MQNMIEGITVDDFEAIREFINKFVKNPELYVPLFFSGGVATSKQGQSIPQYNIIFNLSFCFREGVSEEVLQDEIELVADEFFPQTDFFNIVKTVNNVKLGGEVIPVGIPYFLFVAAESKIIKKVEHRKRTIYTVSLNGWVTRFNGGLTTKMSADHIQQELGNPNVKER